MGSQLSQLRSDFSILKSNATILQSEIVQLRGTGHGNPMILLRTWGTALASYGSSLGGLTYLRLTETGGGSGVEASLASSPFDATVAGASVQWSAWANGVATDRNHTIWPMVLENSPAGTDAIEFEMKGGYQEVAANANGIRSYLGVHWNVSTPHLFKIVIVTPGQQVDFYIDGRLVATLARNIPRTSFLLYAAEVKADVPTTSGVATLDTYGGAGGGT